MNVIHQFFSSVLNLVVANLEPAKEIWSAVHMHLALPFLLLEMCALALISGLKLSI
jgi:hypothetical protein